MGSMTVRVIDRGKSRSYTGVTVRTVTIPATCPTCGGPRGEPRNHNQCEDGDWLSVDVWKNPCGHVDSYTDVLAEARTAAERERDTLIDLHDAMDAGVPVSAWDGGPF